MNALQKLEGLNHQVILYIPSTVDVNKKINNEKYINQVHELFSELFGGSTENKAIGSWKSEELGIVKENITQVGSYTSKEGLNNNIGKVLEYANTLKVELKQEAISLEVDNVLYFI
jgi:hypothetical protein